jgi:hypothetical protein
MNIFLATLGDPTWQKRTAPGEKQCVVSCRYLRYNPLQNTHAVQRGLVQ